MQLSENNISNLNQSIADVKTQLERAQRKLTLKEGESLVSNERYKLIKTQLFKLEKEPEDNRTEKEVQKLKADILKTEENKITQITKAHVKVKEMENKSEMLNEDEGKSILDEQPEYILLFCF